MQEIIAGWWRITPPGIIQVEAIHRYNTLHDRPTDPLLLLGDPWQVPGR